MWKVLIVEDEVFVRESIREIINWQELGYIVVGEAGTGKEALQLMTKLNPDLVLTDIIMPEMDGLELLRKAREMGYQSRFVMLTCMGEFDYVRQAMDYGASSYILKLSMSVQSLRDTLSKISIELRSQENNQNTADIYRKLWDNLYVKDSSQTNDTSYWLGEQHYRWVSIFTFLHGSTPLSLEDLQASVNEAQGVSHTYTASGMTSLFFWSTERLSTDIIYSSPFPHSFKLNGSYKELSEMWRLTIEKLDCVWYSLPEETIAAPHTERKFDEDLIPWNVEKNLLSAFEQGDVYEFQQILDVLWESIKQQRAPSPLVKSNIKRLLGICCRIAATPNSDLSNLDHSKNYEKLNELLLKQIKLILPVNNSLLNAEHPEINKIISYIHNHYADNITVKSMADLTFMDENYISGLFKRKTGKNLISYLHEVRISAAMKYLYESNFSINDICLKVGFANDNYFIKIFKRITNYTPSEYRKTKA